MAQLKIPLKDRICFVCGNNKTYVKKNGIHDWRNVDGKPYCVNCWTRDIYYHKPENKLRDKKNHIIIGKKRLRFKNERHVLKEEFRTGQCQICGNRIGDEYINHKGEKAFTKKIDIHHIQYHNDDHLKDTIEICCSCHIKSHFQTTNNKII